MPPTPAPGDPAAETNMAATYARVLVVELLVIAALYWLSVAFA